MGRLIKNHWARLIVLTAASFQIGSAIEGFIWPKVFWDFMTQNLNGAVTPIPILQILNLLMGLIGIAWEWPLKYVAGSTPHRSIEFRLILYPLSALLAMLLYQGTDPAIYYLIGIGVYFWAYSEGESTGEQHSIPSRSTSVAANAMSPLLLTKPLKEEPGLIRESEEVPVNKKTSFNGKLNQYFHTAKNIATGPTITTTTKHRDNNASVSEQDIAPISFKRKPSSSQQPLSSKEIDELNTCSSSSSSSSKRRRTTTTMHRTLPSATRAAATRTTTRITRSLTRSRTTSSSPFSTASFSPSQSTTPHPEPQLQTTTTTTTKPPRTRTRKSPTPQNTPSLLRDTIPPNLDLLLVGVNPGLLTGITGHAYAHPSNLFWKLLHWSGITAIRHPPSDTYALPELYNIGNTNIVERPTRDASMLSRAEMDAGVPVLEAKVAAQRPAVVCLVGKSIWEAVWRVKTGRNIRKEEFRYGWQDEEMNMGVSTKDGGWPGARVFVATTTSGLAAGMSVAEKQAVWNELGDWVKRRRREREMGEKQQQQSLPQEQIESAAQEDIPGQDP
ncbi:mismatch-specific DNA-glycosylase [Aspergillus saccharolyticus JOP 1030-1]|uniref:DNA glycosylase n=1 Tax=Aspergillus saccharolyticus JOP 1030-1 TaxID=1450539 RepID=A0A318ZSJ5_9EURO|nr:DNA glycosylase [Aspergillus saccharolyticus JOP 1030-1]PYH46920.1 DNA glycosylase [Aspergillus saccharolyticus JOP 1030-1]